MDELPADVRDALNERYGIGNYTATSRTEGDARILIVEWPNRQATWPVVKPTTDRLAKGWRVFAANLVEVRP